MNKKTTMIVCAALVLVLVLALVIWKPFGGKADPTTGNDQENTIVQGENREQQKDTEHTDVEDPQTEDGGTAEDGAQLIQDQGDIIITVPEDEGTGGF